MLKVQEIRELIKLIDESTINEFEYELDGAKILMKKGKDQSEMIQMPVQQAPVQSAPVQQAQQSQTVESAVPQVNEAASKDVAAQEDTKLHKIESPMVGTFYASPSPDADSFVQPGSKVSKDSVVCIVEAMKLFNEIEADIKGEIVETLVENGQLVEYGQPLFLVKSE